MVGKWTFADLSEGYGWSHPTYDTKDEAILAAIKSFPDDEECMVGIVEEFYGSLSVNDREVINLSNFKIDQQGGNILPIKTSTLVAATIPSRSVPSLLEEKRKIEKVKREEIKHALTSNGWNTTYDSEEYVSMISSDGNFKMINDIGVIHIYDMERGNKGALALKILLKDIKVTKKSFGTDALKFFF